MKADLHIHSRHSARAPEWLFRRAGLADSYALPIALYEKLKARGMDFVTITDHNRIEGCLEIADRPGTFISEQISTRFPEDRCAVHLLVWGISELQHREAQSLREDIYGLQAYLYAERLAHAVAHPLYRIDERLQACHLEKLILLFKHFEGRNGHRHWLLSAVATSLCEGLTPAKLEELANRHNLCPTHEEPWQKVLIGGSDDHGGMHPASAWTETAAVVGAPAFLSEVAAGRCKPGGEGGTALTVSHSLYSNLGHFLEAKVAAGQSSSLIAKAFSRFMEGENPTEFSWKDKLSFVAEGIASGQIFELAKPAKASLWKKFATLFGDGEAKAALSRETTGIPEPERRAFVTANFFANQLAFRYFTTFVQKLSGGRIIEAIQDVSVLLPILAPLAPYVYAFRSQRPDRPWLAGLSKALTGAVPPTLLNQKRAWFTDTLEDVNGVANTIKRMTAAVIEDGHDLTVVTSRSTIAISGIPIKNFAPIGEFELPEYELQKLSFPPMLQMIEYIQRENFTELIISTPGPIGLTALLAGKMLGLRVTGIYHTDFPQYVRILTDDNYLETLTWNFMKWFYEQLDLIFVNSEGYRQAWHERGIPVDRIKILPRGLDTALFNPARRDAAFWSKYGLAHGTTVLLYVGRISKEKNLDIIVSAWPKLERGGVALAFVGDGPYLKELRQLLPLAAFTGYLAGLELAQAYASADVFLFPSTTDTFGNVILEAQASAVPCVVSDQGGPKDLVEHGVTGFITKSLDADDFARHVAQLTGSLALRAEMGKAAHRTVQDRDWLDAGRRFWAMSPPES